MKKTLLLILLLALCVLLCPTQASAGYIQSCTAAGVTPATISCTLTGIGANHLLVVAAYSCGPIVFSDTFTFSYTNLGGASNSTNCNLRQRGNGIFVALNHSTTGSDTVSASLSSVTVSESIIFAEYSGTLQNSCTSGCNSLFDANAVAFGTSGGTGTISSGNLTTTTTGDFLLAVGTSSNSSGGSTMTAGTGYTIRASINNTNEDGNPLSSSNTYLEDNLSGTPGTYAATFVQSAAGIWEITLMAMFPSPTAASAQHRKSQVIRYKRCGQCRQSPTLKY